MKRSPTLKCPSIDAGALQHEMESSFVALQRATIAAQKANIALMAAEERAMLARRAFHGGVNALSSATKPQS